MTRLDVCYNSTAMSALVTPFKASYYAGETAKIAVEATGATAVDVVYANSKIALAEDGGVWTGAIPTDDLVGRVNFTVFVKDADGNTEAVAHGAFTVRCAGRSPLRDVVDAIDKAVRTWGTNPNRSLQVGEISITYKSLDELLAVRAQYVQRAEEQERGAALTGGLRTVEVYF